MNHNFLYVSIKKEVVIFINNSGGLKKCASTKMEKNPRCGKLNFHFLLFRKEKYLFLKTPQKMLKKYLFSKSISIFISFVPFEI